jgi:hypothetical protein
MGSITAPQKNKIFILILIVVVLLSLLLGWNKYVIQKDFFVYVYAPCDTESSLCFEYEGEQYLKLYQKAYVLECRDGGLCDVYACSEQDQAQNKCLLVECTEDTLEEGEICINNKEI